MTSTQALVTTCLSLLETHLPAKLAAADLPPIEKWLPYDPTLHSPLNCPTLWVEVIRNEPTGPAGFGGANATETRARVMRIGFTCAGMNPEVAQLALYGYGDLIQETLLENLTAGGAAHDLRAGTTRFDMVLPEGNAIKALFRFGLLEFTATRWRVLGAD